MSKIILDEKEICERYINDNIGVEKMALEYHVGKLRIKSILEKNGIEIKKKGKQPLKVEFIVNDYHVKKYENNDEYSYLAYDKNTNFSSKDIDNKGGVLTSYIDKQYGVKTPTLYDRRKYYMETGNYWWEQWLSYKKVYKVPTKKCPYCNWETVDIENKSGAFEQHLFHEHNKTKFEYLEEYPEDKKYFLGVNLLTNRQLEEDKDKYVTCAICGKKLARLDSRHLNKHGITKEEYVKKYGNDLISKDYHDRISAIVIEENKNSIPVKHSSDELEIVKYINDIGFECNTDREVLNGKEIDIFIPSKNIGIEYNGNLWHTERFGKKDSSYHYNKTILANKNGVGLIQIFEDEYNLHKDIVLNKISHILGVQTNLPKIYARKCEIKEIYMYEAKEFLDKYHIQGFSTATYYFGAFYNNELVAVMTFKKDGGNNYDLTRFASNYNYVCCGIGGKMFKHFIKMYNPDEIKSFADRRWTLNKEDNIYTKLGFKLVAENAPDYRYYNPKVDRYERFHKFGFRKQVLSKKYNLPIEMTETEMTKKLGYDKIWDCGLLKYVFYNK